MYTYPRSAGQWCWTPIWPHTFHKRLIITGFFFHHFTSERLRLSRLFPSPQFEKKKITKTPGRSGLEPKVIRSRIFGLSTWAICELTNAGGKKSIKLFWTGQPRTTCTGIAALAAQKHDAFVSYFPNRRTSQWWASYSQAWDKTLFPSASKYRLDYFPTLHIDRGAAEVKM